jgi:hypothetical protein
VEKCPDPYGDGTPWSVKIAQAARESEDSIKAKLVCKYGVVRSNQTVAQLIDKRKQQCASFIIPSRTSESCMSHKLSFFTSHSITLKIFTESLIY